MTPHLLHHPDADIRLTPRSDGDGFHISVAIHDANRFIPIRECTTRYPVSLIEAILNIKGPAYLCDEVNRDESPDYVQRFLQYEVLGYVAPEKFEGKRILDFGCGSGASSAVLARLLPRADITGVELNEALLEIARARMEHHRLQDRLRFLVSPHGDVLPPDLGEFDHILLSAVYEHLLPQERKRLLPVIWQHLKPGGILFVNQTPFRWFPIEIHTTSGLPLINYLPDSIAHGYATRFCKRVSRDASWEGLLRAGIRGASIREIMNILKLNGAQPELLKPCRLGLNNRIDLWYEKTNKSQHPTQVKIIYYVAKTLHALTGLELQPNLSLAIKKNNRR
ncbi:MAG: class I SAM-dependent methyltransferase [Nitrospina sp.]|nr:class I SAM-dependent methyltransferase [Nitrospina sp.]